MAGRVAPFATIAVAAVAVAMPGVGPERMPWLLVGAGLTALTITLSVVLALVHSRVAWSAWVEAIPPYVFIGAVVAVRHALSGAESGYSPLFLVPTLWLALYGTRWQLFGALGLIAAALMAPILLTGAPEYPPTEWRRAAILVGVAATLGFIVQALVQEARAGAAGAEAATREVSAQRDVTEAIITAASDAVVSFDRFGSIIAANAEAATMFQRPDLIGQDVFEVLVPDDERDRLRAGFARVVASEQPGDREARFEAELVRADATRVAVEIAVARTRGVDGPLIHAFVRNTSARQAAEQDARDHLTDLDQLLSVARDLGATGVDGRTAICAAACQLARADFALFYTPDGDGRRLIATGSAGSDTPKDIIELDARTSVAGQVLRSGVATFAGDLANDERVDQRVVRSVQAGAAFWQPISIDGRPAGVLVAYWRRPIEQMPDRIVTLFGLFAAQAATVIERADLLGRLETLARTDALTGAANRRTLDEALAMAISEAQRSGRPLSIVMLDLDHFKRYNDRHGHQAGDDLLRAAVAAWDGELRPGDILARYGGEEFLAVLPSSDPAGSVVVADRLRSALPDGVGASAGAATWDGEESGAALIARADAALYRAKKAGRARTVASVPGESDA